MKYIINPENDISVEETKVEILSLLPHIEEFRKQLQDTREDLDDDQIDTMVSNYRIIVDMLKDCQ